MQPKNIYIPIGIAFTLLGLIVTAVSSFYSLDGRVRVLEARPNNADSVTMLMVQMEAMQKQNMELKNQISDLQKQITELTKAILSNR